MRQFIVRPNKYGVGIDVGWRVWSGHPNDAGQPPVDLWWGNTKDTDSLRLLIEDARRQGYVFDLATEVRDAVVIGGERELPMV